MNIVELHKRRHEIWQQFVATYQVALITEPEKFSEFCEKFRERWLRGE